MIPGDPADQGDPRSVPEEFRAGVDGGGKVFVPLDDDPFSIIAKADRSIVTFELGADQAVRIEALALHHVEDHGCYAGLPMAPRDHDPFLFLAHFGDELREGEGRDFELSGTEEFGILLFSVHSQDHPVQASVEAVRIPDLIVR